MSMETSLESKYNVAAPRYTSYPTVPYWEVSSFNKERWCDALVTSTQGIDAQSGISLYIHLPFCESLCTYCGCNTRITKNHGVELPYIKAVIKEWQMYLRLLGTKPVIKELHLGGGTPTFFSAENLNLLISGILEHAELHIDAAFSFEGHPDNTTEEHLRSLYRLGFKRISLGIQDFDPKVQHIINRIQSVEQVLEITQKAREVGYTSINYDLIYGLPLQTMAGLTDTIKSVVELRPDRIAFYSYAHVPWVKPGQRQFTEQHLPSAELKQQLYETGRELLKDGGYIEVGMDHFTLKTDSLYLAEKAGKLHRNFMGYSDQYSRVMIGLGVSAIGDCWTGFAQNEKRVEAYLNLINKGILPLVKGHILNQEDLIIRKHILNIMCHGATSWKEPSDCCPALLEGIERMKSLEADGLVQIADHMLMVTKIGKRYLRNICMSLDARLWQSQPKAQLFSMAD
jgi:oxygen-independent coproporphyrinogen-3 oxidase